MHYKKIKQLFLLLGLLIPAAWCVSAPNGLTDGQDHIIIKESHVQNVPRDYAIQATINGHYLTVVFTENFGQVTVEVSKESGGETQIESTPTPNGVNFYIYEICEILPVENRLYHGCHNSKPFHVQPF